MTLTTSRWNNVIIGEPCSKYPLLIGNRKLQCSKRSFVAALMYTNVEVYFQNSGLSLPIQCLQVSSVLCVHLCFLDQQGGYYRACLGLKKIKIFCFNTCAFPMFYSFINEASTEKCQKSSRNSKRSKLPVWADNISIVPLYIR